MQYTIKAAMPTGKNDSKFGQEFYIQFNEMNDAPALWFKAQPEVGSALDLEQVNGRWKKVKKEWNPNGSSSQSTSTPSNGMTGSPAKPAYKDNSDGMRQGMCINNAANYVNSLTFEKTLTDREWAETVHAYATALYKLGDLKSNTDDVAHTVTEVFSN